MELRKQRFLWIVGLFVSLLIFTSFTKSQLDAKSNEGLDSHPIASANHFDFVSEILDSKLNEYNSSGYFSQIYQPSLQATYYALYILDVIGRTSTINQSKILNFIMSCYNQSSNTFTDDYSQRYLDMNATKTYYPYTSLLEVNCYAILSLEILNSLNQIDEQESIDFIWSCYQPTTSGFIGQPYDSGLPDYFKISTMDNTYFAIVTLDLLMNNWNSYITEKSEIVQYIQHLQSTNTFFWYFGGFENDMDQTIDTIDLFEPNLLSSYYCIKSLDIFGMIDVINLNNFHQFLDGLYDPATFSFQMSHFAFEDYGNIVGTSLGLTSANLTGFTGIDRTEVINFILNNRNNKGLWNYSTDDIYCELIDTYQVIRSLSDSGELSQLSENNKDLISSALFIFNSYQGFSLLSKDYTSTNLLYTIINSFDLYNRTLELDDEYLYSTIEKSLLYYSTSDCEGFLGGLFFEEDLRKYRSFPLEYYYSGNQQHYQEEGAFLVSHRSTSQALASLKILGKLDELGGTHNLTKLLDSILDSQFLMMGYENYGGFLPFLTFSLGTPEYQNEVIYLDYSYFGISVMELLSNYLGLGNLSSLAFDKLALSSYIHNNFYEDVIYQYFSPGYTMNPEILIENTFYAASILKSIDLYDLDEEKIKNFVLDFINYSNIRNIYYSYKISSILDEKIPFNYDLIYQLIGNIYSGELKEYFTTLDKNKIEQEILLWIADMIVNDLGNSFTSIHIDYLEGCKFLSTGNNITFTITSKYTGTYWYWIDGILVDSQTFNSGGETIVYSLDSYTGTIKDYNIKINASVLDGSYEEISTIFSVYSDSSTIVNILSLGNYEFMTTGHNITFSLHSQYPDWYNLSIDNIEVSVGNYTDGEIFTIPIDGYEVGDHNVVIWSRGLDDKEGTASSNFSVYSTSETIITIHSIDNYVYNSTGNLLNFSISSDFPENYTIEIDGILVYEGTYTSNFPILISIDGYIAGVHVVDIWANSSDKKETSSNTQFDVFSESFVEIEIRHLHNYEFRLTGNYITFFINASFPDSFTFSVDGALLEYSNYQYGGDFFNYSIDGYPVGDHNVSIWANSTDGKESISEAIFTVYSLSVTIVHIEELTDYEFQTIGHFVTFNISSMYPDYYILSIDGIEVNRCDYNSGVFYDISIDGYDTGYHSLLIWAIGEDGKIGTASSGFNVYSNSSAIIMINEVPNYEFMTTGHYINFSVSSYFNGVYNVSIDGVLVDNGIYIIDKTVICVSDGYFIGNHNVLIVAKSFDGKVGQYETVFTVFSNSTTLITIHGLEGCEFMSTGNFINFSIGSSYPDYYTLWINSIMVISGNYTSEEIIQYSLDNYTAIIGNYSVYIWAIGLDGKVGELYAGFNVYSTSSTIISINMLNDLEFLSNNNTMIFTIHCNHPDYYELWIDGILLQTDIYKNENPISFSLDNYTSIIRNHSVFIWAIGLDGRIGTITSDFRIITSSIITINITCLNDYEFNSTGNNICFALFSEYPDYFIFSINELTIDSGDFIDGQNFTFSIDGYEIGTHNITIWARGRDGKETEVMIAFTVYLTKEIETEKGIEMEIISSAILITILISGPSMVLIGSSFYIRKNNANNSLKKPFQERRKK